MYILKFAPQALEDLSRLKKSEPAAFKKAGKLLAELQEHPQTAPEGGVCGKFAIFSLFLYR